MAKWGEDDCELLLRRVHSTLKELLGKDLITKHRGELTLVRKIIADIQEEMKNEDSNA